MVKSAFSRLREQLVSVVVKMVCSFRFVVT